jgi:hypothetical protein
MFIVEKISTLMTLGEEAGIITTQRIEKKTAGLSRQLYTIFLYGVYHLPLSPVASFLGER